MHDNIFEKDSGKMGLSLSVNEDNSLEMSVSERRERWSLLVPKCRSDWKELTLNDWINRKPTYLIYLPFQSRSECLTFATIIIEHVKDSRVHQHANFNFGGFDFSIATSEINQVVLFIMQKGMKQPHTYFYLSKRSAAALCKCCEAVCDFFDQEE